MVDKYASKVMKECWVDTFNWILCLEVDFGINVVVIWERAGDYKALWDLMHDWRIPNLFTGLWDKFLMIWVWVGKSKSLLLDLVWCVWLGILI